MPELSTFSIEDKVSEEETDQWRWRDLEYQTALLELVRLQSLTTTDKFVDMILPGAVEMEHTIIKLHKIQTVSDDA